MFCGVRVPGLALGISASTGLREIGPALAGNVGASWAFALSRDGNQDVDVPMLAPARSRYRWVAWGPVPLWGGLIVGYEEKQSSLTRCVVVMALRALRALRALGALGRWGHEGGGGSGKGAALGVPQRGTAYQPGVKPRVCRTTGAF